jgi:hypothetical protein
VEYKSVIYNTADYTGGLYDLYSTVDTMTMFVFGPLVKYFIIPWAKPIVCWTLLNLVLDNLNLTSSLKNSFSVCQQGVDVMVEQFYY